MPKNTSILLLSVCAALTSARCLAVPTSPTAVAAQGQTPEQLEQDKSACYANARTVTGFDPNSGSTLAAPAPAAPSEGRGRKAVKRAAGGAALGAAVGAIAGDAGKGAAIGATAGGVHSITQNDRGAAGGALSDAAVGAAAGAVGGDAGKGAAIGAAVGTVAGAAKKTRLNKQQAEAQQQASAAYEQQLAKYNGAFAACMQQRGHDIQ